MSNIKYVVRYSCVKCLKNLTHDERANSSGVCPYCGNVSLAGIVDCNKSSEEIELYKVVKVEPHIDLSEYAGYGGYKPNPPPKVSWFRGLINWIFRGE